VHTLLHPDCTHCESIGVADIDTEEEKAHRCAGSKSLLDTSFCDLLQVSGVILDFKIFLAERNNDTDSLKSLLGITSTLAISFCRGDGSFLLDVGKNAHTYHHDWSDSKHDKGKIPALVECNGESGNEHRQGVNNLTIFLANTVFDEVNVFVNS